MASDKAIPENKAPFSSRPIQPMQSWTEDGHSGGSTEGGQSICQARTGMD